MLNVIKGLRDKGVKIIILNSVELFPGLTTYYSNGSTLTVSERISTDELQARIHKCEARIKGLQPDNFIVKLKKQLKD